jgi:hypothetical protein
MVATVREGIHGGNRQRKNPWCQHQRRGTPRDTLWPIRMAGLQFIQRCVAEFRVMLLNHTHGPGWPGFNPSNIVNPTSRGELQNPVLKREHRAQSYRLCALACFCCCVRLQFIQRYVARCMVSAGMKTGAAACAFSVPIEFTAMAAEKHTRLDGWLQKPKRHRVITRQRNTHTNLSHNKVP